MIDPDLTLGELLTDPRIAPIAPDAVRNLDLSREPQWAMTLPRLRESGFGGEIAAGLDRLFRAAEAGNWHHPLYTEAECAAQPERRGVSLVTFPSEDPSAADRPWLLIVPGGGFVNVWNLTEGWPIAALFNSRGYHAAVLTYRVEGERRLERDMEDMARAVCAVGEQALLPVSRPERYATCGFSAGGCLVCLWNVPEAGYALHGLPKPAACIPVYPVVSPREMLRDGAFRPDAPSAVYGMSMREAAETFFEIPDHTEGFPPSAIFLGTDDQLVPPAHSHLLAGSLARNGIPCRLEIGPCAGHGFGDGTGTSMAGWTARAADWLRALASTNRD